jgi:lipid II:glycine glycyltransferase (peptidoglycan interpeptide bridge formation enzyme)
MESRSASSRRGYETCSAYLIKHAALDLLRDEGVEVLNLSAVPAAASDSDHPQHGLFEFKAGFGGQSNIRTSVQIPIKEAVSGLSSHPPGVR